MAAKTKTPKAGLFPLTLQTFQDEPEKVVHAIFGEGGVLSGMVDGFRVNPTQIEYAVYLAKTAARGLSPDLKGRISMVEASTGTGKTLAYMVVGLLAAMLTGRRLMVSTFTRALLFQVVGADGDLARRIVAKVLGSEDGHTYNGRAITVAPRRSRSAFVSPSRARVYAEELRQAGKPEAADALETYAAMAQAAIERVAAGEKEEVVADFAGLIETFDAERQDLADIVAELPPDRFILTGLCPEAEQLVWRAYRDIANEAVAIVVTHAAFLIDMSLHGRLTRANRNGFALAVVDEAHALEKAAQSAFGTKRSISELARDAARLRIDFENDETLTDGERKRLISAADAYGAAATALADLLKADVKKRGTNPQFDIIGDEPWMKALTALRKTMDALCVELVAINRPSTLEKSREIDQKEEDIASVVKAVEYRGETGKAGLFRPVVSLTPKREDPSLQLKPVQGQRLASRMWSRGRERDREPMADALVFTSATLGHPGREGWEAFEGMARTLGVDPERQEVNMDLCASLENPDFGKPTFMWADPKAPYMTGEGRNGVVTVEGAAYVATAIAAASRMPNPVRGTCRQIVLSKNFDDLYVIHDALPPELREKCVLRSRQMSLRKAVALWREREDAILLTCGAHEGLNEPGRVDHLILYRLPFDPPPEGEKKGSFATSVFDMLRTLRQAIGRGVRQASDNPVIWMLDVRVPPPEAVQARERAFFDKASARPSFLSAFPRRWKKAMDRGRILPCPDRLRRRPNAPPPTEEEI